MGVDVFISYAGRDRAWADWAYWHLTEAGHRVEMDHLDWAVGEDWVLRINDALERAAYVVALVSVAYFDRDRFTTIEWTAMLADRSAAPGRRLLPLRVENCVLPPLWRRLAYADVFGLSEAQAREVLLAAVDGPAAKPTAPPAFPGEASRTVGPRVPGSFPPVWNVPARLTVFTGRDDVLVHLRESLLSQNRAAVHTLSGMGGVGKSLLAVEYAHRFAGDYELVWWVNAEQPDLIGEQLAAFAAAAGVASLGMDVPMAVGAIRGLLRERNRWLVIFDNARGAKEIADWLPQGDGQVIVTSRSPSWTGVAEPIPIGVFDRIESMALVSAYLPELGEADARRLAAALGDLPLALAQAAGVIAETGMPVSEYLAVLQATAEQVLATGTPVRYGASLAASVQVSTDRLSADDPAAGHLLRLCALLGPEAIPTWLFTAAAASLPAPLGVLDVFSLRQCVGRAARYGLLQVGADTVTMHRLTQAVIRDHLTPDERNIDQSTVEVALVASLPDDGTDPASWSRWEQLLPHILAQNATSTTNRALMSLACSAVGYLHSRGDDATAMNIGRLLHQRWKQAHGADDLYVLRAADNLAATYRGVGQYKKARRVDDDTLTRRQRVLGDDHPDTLRSANSLGTDLQELGLYDLARQLNEDTLTRYRRVLGDDHPDSLRSANNVAIDLRQLGHYRKARQLDGDTLARRQRVLGVDHPDTLASANNLAAGLRKLGAYTEARKLDEDTLGRYRRVLGEDHPSTLASANNLAVDLRHLGRYEEAHQLDEDTLSRYRRVLGEGHPDTLRSANNLAVDLRELGLYVRARELGLHDQVRQLNEAVARRLRGRLAMPRGEDRALHDRVLHLDDPNRDLRPTPPRESDRRSGE